MGDKVEATWHPNTGPTPKPEKKQKPVEPMTTEEVVRLLSVRFPHDRREEQMKPFYAWLDEHDLALSEKRWDEGYRSGHSRAMRKMSDEPGVADGVNPYQVEGGPNA